MQLAKDRRHAIGSPGWLDLITTSIVYCSIFFHVYAVPLYSKLYWAETAYVLFVISQPTAGALPVWQFNSLSVRLSVCPIHYWYCVKTAKYIVEILSPPDSVTIQVFCNLISVNKFWQGHIPQSQIQEGHKLLDFSPISRYIWKILHNMEEYSHN